MQETSIFALYVHIDKRCKKNSETFFLNELPYLNQVFANNKAILRRKSPLLMHYQYPFMWGSE